MRGDNFLKCGLNPINKNLRNQLVNSVIKTNGSNLLDGFRMADFWYKIEEGIICSTGKLLGKKDILDLFQKGVPNCGLEFLKENWL